MDPQQTAQTWHTISPLLFWLIAGLTGLSAIATVVTQNIVRAATWLLFTLGGTSAVFFLLGADLVGVTQLLVYVGGTLVLVVFGVMLTAQGPFISMKTSGPEWAISIVAGMALLGVLATGIPEHIELDTTKVRTTEFDEILKGDRTVRVSPEVKKYAPARSRYQHEEDASRPSPPRNPEGVVRFGPPDGMPKDKGGEKKGKGGEKKDKGGGKKGGGAMGGGKGPEKKDPPQDTALPKLIPLEPTGANEQPREIPPDRRTEKPEMLDPATSPQSATLGQGFLGVGVGPAHPGGQQAGKPIVRTSYLLPFEIVSVHLLVVLIGAAYLARAKRRRGAPS